VYSCGGVGSRCTGSGDDEAGETSVVVARLDGVERSLSFWMMRTASPRRAIWNGSSSLSDGGADESGELESELLVDMARGVGRVSRVGLDAML
jgi:hypothetical protein